jgi:peptidoglycan hydrolase-like protein with peptidoglycan-binding domain
MSGADVKKLQEFLNTHGFPIATSGQGALGAETDYFGSLTKKALAAYQKANGIKPAAGYFGPRTRAFINAHQ